MIEADGTPLVPINVHTFPIHVAQRYSFILDTNQTTDLHWIRALMNTNCFQDSDGLNPLVLGILQYNDTAGLPNTTAWDDTMDVICQDLNLTESSPLNYVNDPMPPTSNIFIRVDVSFQTGAGDLNFGYLNTTSWTPLNDSNILLQSTTQNQTSVLGVDQAFPLNHQLVYSIPTINTVEYILLCYPIANQP